VTRLRAGQSTVRFPVDTLIYFLPTTSKPALGSARRQVHWSGGGAKLTTHLHLAPIWRISGAMFPIPHKPLRPAQAQIDLQLLLHNINVGIWKEWRVLLAKLIVAQLVQTFLALFTTQSILSCSHEPTLPVLNQMNPLHYTASALSFHLFNVFLVAPSGFPPDNPCVSVHPCFVSNPSNCSSFDSYLCVGGCVCVYVCVYIYISSYSESSPCTFFFTSCQLLTFVCK
jgi:hypothetical protein